jgi:hypothetical protein
MITINQRNEVERERCRAEYNDKKERQNSCYLFSHYKSRNIISQIYIISKHHFDTIL